MDLAPEWPHNLIPRKKIIKKQKKNAYKWRCVLVVASYRIQQLQFYGFKKMFNLLKSSNEISKFH